MSLLRINIYLDNLIHNFNFLKAQTPNLAAVVKADGYGLGAVTVTKTLKRLNCHKFFVATASEGKILRKKFPDIDIYVFDGFIEQKTILEYHLKPVINTVEQLNEFNQTPNKQGAILHIDTGMNRLGIPVGDVHKINLSDEQKTKIDYIMTHLSDSETNAMMSEKQTYQLLQIASHLKIKNISIANSGGILLYTNIQKGFLGRAGIALYGGFENINLRPVVSVIGNILQKKHILTNEPVGYGNTFITQRPTTLFTVAGGYADGIQRSLSHSGFMGFVHGYKIPLIGRVSMDTTIFDATDLPNDILNNATELEFFGLNNSIHEISDCAKTIPYEFLTNLSRRANRVIV